MLPLLTEAGKFFPRTVPWTDEMLQQLFAAVDRGSAGGKRDYAMLLLAARLGLRIGADILAARGATLVPASDVPPRRRHLGEIRSGRDRSYHCYRSAVYYVKDQ